MTEQPHPLLQLLQEDRRYKLEAYQFVREALDFAQTSSAASSARPRRAGQEPPTEAHLTGQQLCEAIRAFALDQFGYMAKWVLKSWGITSTSDFGEIVYNLIRINVMKKSKSDRREDFDNVYDFDDAFVRRFKIKPRA